MRRCGWWTVVALVVAAIASACGSTDESPSAAPAPTAGSSPAPPTSAEAVSVACGDLFAPTVVAGQPPPTALPTIPAECVDPPPTSDAERVRAEIEDRMPDDHRFLEVWEDGGVVHVRLRADGEDVAGELTQRYGDRVAVTVGRFGYPGTVPDPTVGDCAVPAAGPGGAAVQAVAVIETAPDRPGAWGSGSIRLHNDGTEPIRFTSGTATAVLVRDGRPVGVYEGALFSTGIGVDLPPGGDASVPFVVGSASCDPALGYALGPGTYDLVVAVPGITGVVTGPVPVTIPASPATTRAPATSPTATATTGVAEVPAPPADTGATRLWLSETEIPVGGADVAAFLVSDGPTGDTFGVAAALDRWDRDTWSLVTNLAVCLDFWSCVGTLDPPSAVPAIGLVTGSRGDGSAWVGAAELVHIGGLDPGWYRLRQVANAGTTATGTFRVVDSPRATPPLTDVTGDHLVVTPALVPPTGFDVTVAVNPVPKGPISAGDLTAFAGSLSPDTTLQGWDGTAWVDSAHLTGAVASLNWQQIVSIPPLDPGAYRLVRTTASGEAVPGHFWVE